MGAGMLLLLLAAEEYEKKSRNSNRSETKEKKSRDYEYSHVSHNKKASTINDHIIEEIMEKEPNLTTFFEMLRKEYRKDKEIVIREKTKEKEDSEKEGENILVNIEQEYLPRLKTLLKEKGIEVRDIRIIYNRPWYSGNAGFSIKIDGESLFFDTKQAKDCLETIKTELIPEAKDSLEHPENSFIGRKKMEISRQIAKLEEEAEKISIERKGFVEEVKKLKTELEQDLSEYKQREQEDSSKTKIQKIKSLVGLLSSEKRQEKKERDSIKIELRKKMDEKYRKIVELQKDIESMDFQKEEKNQKMNPLKESLLELSKEQEHVQLETKKRIEILETLLSLETIHREEFKDTIKRLGHCLLEKDRQEKLYYEIVHLKDENCNFHEDILEKTYERLIAEGKISEENLVGVFEELKKIEQGRKLRGYESMYIGSISDRIITRRIVDWFVKKVYRTKPDYVETVHSFLEEKISQDSETTKKYRKR